MIFIDNFFFLIIDIGVLPTSYDYFLMKKMFYLKNGQINVFFNCSLIWPIFIIRFENFQHCANFAILPLCNFTEFCNSLVNLSSPLTDCKIDFINWPKNSNLLNWLKFQKTQKFF